MKGLILHCRNFSFKDIENSTKPAGISATIKDRPLTQGIYEKKVVILSCVEAGDTEVVIRKAAEHIIDMVEKWHGGNKNLLILPFAHLSNNIAQPSQSGNLINLFTEVLRSQTNVELITFGSHKEWMVDVYGYPRATSWFQFP